VALDAVFREERFQELIKCSVFRLGVPGDAQRERAGEQAFNSDLVHYDHLRYLYSLFSGLRSKAVKVSALQKVAHNL
jgi:hypothetical protein